MCVIYHMSYEFNNWKCFFEVKEFGGRRHIKNYPVYDIKVPIVLSGEGWESLETATIALRDHVPENLEEMSIYGTISFTVNKDENRNRGSARGIIE